MYPREITTEDIHFIAIRVFFSLLDVFCYLSLLTSMKIDRSKLKKYLPEPVSLGDFLGKNSLRLF